MFWNYWLTASAASYNHAMCTLTQNQYTITMNCHKIRDPTPRYKYTGILTLSNNGIKMTLCMCVRERSTNQNLWVMRDPPPRYNSTIINNGMKMSKRWHTDSTETENWNWNGYKLWPRKVLMSPAGYVEVNGKDEALQCGGECRFWLHRGCASVPPSHFVLSTSDEPFVCLCCSNIQLIKKHAPLSSELRDALGLYTNGPCCQQISNLSRLWHWRWKRKKRSLQSIQNECRSLQVETLPTLRRQPLESQLEQTAMYTTTLQEQWHKRDQTTPKASEITHKPREL